MSHLSSVRVHSSASIEHLLCAELLIGSHRHSASHMGRECLFFTVNSSERGRESRVRLKTWVGKLLGCLPCPHHSSLTPKRVELQSLRFLLALTHLFPYCYQGRRSQVHLPPTRGARSSAPRPRSPRRRWWPASACQALLRCKGQLYCVCPCPPVCRWLSSHPLLGGGEGILWPHPGVSEGQWVYPWFCEQP